MLLGGVLRFACQGENRISGAKLWCSAAGTLPNTLFCSPDRQELRALRNRVLHMA
jgi:hypothetical protein